jgi:hypothetical protein
MAAFIYAIIIGLTLVLTASALVENMAYRQATSVPPFRRSFVNYDAERNL